MCRLFIIFLALSACRAERICDFHMEGICFNDGGYPMVPEMISAALEYTYEEVTSHYGISFNARRIAEKADLYVMYKDESVVAEVSGVEGAIGYYIPNFDEIVVGFSQDYDNEQVYFRAHATLAHEMLHFWTEHVLQEKFGITDKMNATHMTPNLWRIWAWENGIPSNETIEGRVRSRLNKLYKELYEEE